MSLESDSQTHRADASVCVSRQRQPNQAETNECTISHQGGELDCIIFTHSNTKSTVFR